MRNALTIDLEDWYHPELVRHHLPGSTPGTEGLRRTLIERSTQHLLNMLRERGISATFFVVGEVAQQHPQLIQTIVEHGHELACHGMSHKPLWEMTADTFRAELDAFGATMLEIVPHVEIVGFRAPTFSLDNGTRWALNVLAEHGFRYDSSVFPVRTPVYGVATAPLAPYCPSAQDIAVADEKAELVEFPMSVWSLLGWRVPVSGGFYLRALPFRLVKYCLQQINRQRPFAVYVHPWEISSDTPRLALPLTARFVTYYNMANMLPRLESLLDTFSFAPMRTVLQEMGKLNGLRQSRGETQCQ
jgi:polysaccharide deacetylase family protein (PEP-CTERM system associated)